MCFEYNNVDIDIIWYAKILHFSPYFIDCLLIE